MNNGPDCEFLETNLGTYKCTRCGKSQDTATSRECLIPKINFERYVKQDVYQGLIPGAGYDNYLSNINYNFKLVGLPYSGTNLVCKLMVYNFKPQNHSTLIFHAFNRHSPINYLQDNEERILICTRNIYSWLVSVWHRRATLKAKSLMSKGVVEGEHIARISNFRDKTKAKFLRENFLNFLIRYKTAVTNEMEIYYKDYPDYNTIEEAMMTWRTWFSIQDYYQVKNEDYIKNPISVIKNLQNKFKFKTHNQLFPHIIDNRADGPEHKILDKLFEKHKYYLNNEYLICYNQRTLDFVNENIDEKLYTKMGYKIICSMPFIRHHSLLGEQFIV